MNYSGASAVARSSTAAAPDALPPRPLPAESGATAPPLSVSIVSINYAPELTGIGVYTTGTAEFLARAGAKVSVHTAFPYYPAWSKRSGDRRTLFRREAGSRVSVRRSYVFVPSRPTAIRRVLHELSFVLSASVGYLFAPRAAVTVVVSPPLALGVPLGLLARLKRSRLVFHVQDLQPDTAIELGMLPRGMLARVLHLLERASYRLADRVSVISDGMAERVRGKGVPAAKVVVFRNWADVEQVVPGARETRFRAAWGLGDRTVVMYAGNLGVKQGLDVLLDAAAILGRTRPDVALVVVGDGGERGRLVARARELGLANLQFRPLQPAERLSELLATADVAVVTQRPTVKDIVMPSKLGNIMGSARPVVAAAAPDSELARTVRDADCGIVVAPQDAVQLAGAVAALADSPALRARLGANGRRFAEGFLSRQAILSEFADRLAELAREGRHPLRDPAAIDA
jgi:colanic acid biosynthesis glycosyl transferase WcaI